MHDILSTFQKHIGAHFEGDMSLQSRASIHRFSEDMKGANEFIGALQSASSALRKILKLAQSVDSESESLLITKARGDIAKLVEEAAFMGVKLFDSTLSTRMGGVEYTLSLDSPLPLVESSKSSPDSAPFSALISYVEEKALEANQTLLALSEALSAPSTRDIGGAEIAGSAQAAHTPESTQEPATLRQLFKGQ